MAASVATMPNYQRVRVLAVLKAQHQAMDRLMALLLTREGELERVGMLAREDMFMPTQSGVIWEAVQAADYAIEKIEHGCRVVA